MRTSLARLYQQLARSVPDEPIEFGQSAGSIRPKVGAGLTDEQQIYLRLEYVKFVDIVPSTFPY